MAKKDANDILFGSAAPAMSFANPGDKIRFKVVSQTSQHRRQVNYDSKADSYSQGDLLYWNDGKPTTVESDAPVLNPVLTVRSTFTKWEGVTNTGRVYGDDDGLRRIFLQGPRALNAIRAAFKDAGIRGKIEPGQYGEITFTKLGKPANKQAKPPKEWAAQWWTADSPPAWASEINAGSTSDDSGDGQPEDDDNPFN